MNNFEIAALKLEEALAEPETTLAEKIKKAVKATKKHKALISDIYDSIITELSLDEFKAELVRMHRSGTEVRLSRSDLPYMEDQEKLKRSTTKYIISEFHHILA